MQGSLGVLVLDNDVQFSSICLGNGDMLIGASNSARTIYSIKTDFDGVGVLGALNVMCSYADGWTNVGSLALSGDKLTVCADGVLCVFVPSQGVTRIVRRSDGLPISSRAVNIAWLGKDILFCEEHSVKLFEPETVVVIAGQGKGDSDGSQSHLKLSQPLGICVQFDRNIYVADSGSDAVKLINKPLTRIAEFLGKLQVLVKAFNILIKKSTVRGPRRSVCEATVVVGEVLGTTKATDGPEGTLSNKSSKSLELMAQSLRKVETNIKDMSSYPGYPMNLNLQSLLTLNVENQHSVTHFKKEIFTLYEYAQIFGSSVEEGVKRVTA